MSVFFVIFLFSKPYIMHNQVDEHFSEHVFGVLDGPERERVGAQPPIKDNPGLCEAQR